MERLGLHAVLPLPRPSVSLCRDAVPTLPGVGYLAGVSSTCFTGSIAAKMGRLLALRIETTSSPWGSRCQSSVLRMNVLPDFTLTQSKRE